MSGIMNSYFYGKAGQGDYTVEQLPTNRRQLFFTTLKVRFSSMIGLNLLQLLWMLPLIIWLFMAFETATMYMDDEQVYKLGGAQMEQAYTEYKAKNDEYRAIVDADKNITALNDEIAALKAKITDIENGTVLTVEEAPVVEGGETTTRPLTVSELQTQIIEKQAAIRVSEQNKAKGADTAFVEQLKSDRDAKYSEFSLMRRQALNGNLLLSLLIMVPFIILAGIGHTGQAYVLRNWARDEHSFMWQDYKASIKANWKQGLAVGLINGLSFVITFVGFITYQSMANSGSMFWMLPQMLMLVLFVVWWMANEVIFPMMVTYDMKVKDLIRNSIIMSLARLPYAFLILLGTVAVPVLILLIPLNGIPILILLLFYGLFGFSLGGFVRASFANYCFDKYLNPRIEGAAVNQGLHLESDDDDEPEKPAEPAEEAKEDRFWEHKTK